MISMIDILNIPHGELLPCKFEWGAQNFSFPTLFVFYRELLLRQTQIFLILYSTASLKLATILNHSLSLKFTLFYRKVQNYFRSQVPSWTWDSLNLLSFPQMNIFSQFLSGKRKVDIPHDFEFDGAKPAH